MRHGTRAVTGFVAVSQEPFRMSSQSVSNVIRHIDPARLRFSEVLAGEGIQWYWRRSRPRSTGG